MCGEGVVVSLPDEDIWAEGRYVPHAECRQPASWVWRGTGQQPQVVPPGPGPRLPTRGPTSASRTLTRRLSPKKQLRPDPGGDLGQVTPLSLHFRDSVLREGGGDAGSRQDPWVLLLLPPRKQGHRLMGTQAPRCQRRSWPWQRPQHRENQAAALGFFPVAPTLP